MSHSDQKHRMNIKERHILGVDHTPNKEHGASLSAATVTLTDEYSKQLVNTSILTAVTINGLQASALIGDFPRAGKYRLTFSCTIGTQVFVDSIIISVEE